MHYESEIMAKKIAKKVFELQSFLIMSAPRRYKI